MSAGGIALQDAVCDLAEDEFMFERIEMNITGSMRPPCDSVHLQKPTEKSRLIWVSFFLHVAGL